MSISGNLRTLGFTELLQWLSQGTKTGTLVIANGEFEKRVFFDKGTIISTASNNPKEYLGQFLLSHGLIDELVLAKAMEMQEENRMMLGKILVTIGAITEEDLDHMLRLKAEESLYEIFTWQKGEFHFLDGELPSFTMIPLQVNVTHLVLEGTQRVDDWNRMRGRITSPSSVPVSVTELVPEDPQDRMAKRILQLVDDDRTIEEIALHAHTGDYQVCRVLFHQLEKGAVKIVRPRTVAAASPESAVRVDAGDVEVDSLLEAADRLLDDAEYEKALRRMRAALSLEPDSKSTQDAIKAAEAIIQNRLDAEGITLTAVPRLERSFDELAGLEISPQEGFILTRVNNTYDIQTIVKISPMPQLDALLTFWRLEKAGHIQLSQPS
jgi:hypothetical protein